MRHPGVGSVVFTGSVETGEQVARDAGLKNRVLELGGNGPQIVLADADIEKAADAAITGCFYLAGQCCTAAERILVHRDVKDAFVEALLERTQAPSGWATRWTMTPTWARCPRRPCSRRTQRARRGRGRQGRRVVHGGGTEGQFHEPTVSTASPATCGSRRRRRSARSRRS